MTGGGAVSTLSNTSGPEGLRYLEGLLQEVGSHISAGSLSAAPAPGSGPVRASRPVPSSQVRDCLEANQKMGGGGVNGSALQQSRHEMSSIARRSPSPANLTKGALLLGKSEDTPVRYFGREFASRSESPGPIYDPPLSTFQVMKSLTFAKAPKRTLEVQSMTSEAVSELSCSIPGSIGRQVSSQHSSAATASFPRANRFNSKLFLSRVHNDNRGLESPAPTAYQPSEAGSTNSGHGAILCGGRISSSKMFISRAHTADCIGAESPGPIYHPWDGARKEAGGLEHPFERPVSTLPSAPAVSFTGSRSHSSMARLSVTSDITNPNCRCHMETSEETGKVRRCCIHDASQPDGISIAMPQEPFISHAHSKVQSTSNTPGPAYYTPSHSQDFLERRPAVGFTKAKMSSGAERYTSPSPGPKYDPSDAHIKPNTHTTTFGSRFPSEDRSTRFVSDTQYLGKGLVVGEGRHSPGPVYLPSDAAVRPDAVAVTMAFKEAAGGVYTKRLFPGPSRPRFLSEDLARENLGSYSPGPKYDTRGDITKEGVCYTFPRPATFERATDDDGDDNAAMAGAAGSLNGSAGAVRRKKKKVVLLYPHDDFLSTCKKGPAIKISPCPAPSQKSSPLRPGSPGSDSGSPTNGAGNEGGNENGSPKGKAHDGTSRAGMPPLPKYELIEKQYPAVSFSKNSRLPPQRQVVQPGPTQYSPNWSHVEVRQPSHSIGLL